MAINFPDTPTLYQSHTSSGRSWLYDGEKWVLIYASINVDGGFASSVYVGIEPIDGGFA